MAKKSTKIVGGHKGHMAMGKAGKGSMKKFGSKKR